ncbi:MAG: T9SS type A sorting domain-containing protein [Caldithrix sp.]|nr:MAG: T9SS type A sorting domain-containing protein [Caldithrix sp.]
MRYSLVQNSNVILKVFNILGQEIQTLVNKTQVAGEYEISWNSGDLPSGLYVYRLQAGQSVEIRKMILPKIKEIVDKARGGFFAPFHK